jgi:hypothetical protein
VDTGLVQRNTAAKLDGSRSKAGFLLRSPGGQHQDGGPYSMKVPKG